MSDSNLSMLRHTVATLAYRGAKTLHGAPAAFVDFKAPPVPGIQVTRTPVQILAHIGDLLDWAMSLANGKHE